MLSRLALRNAQLLPMAMRGMQSLSSAASASAAAPATPPPRPKRPIEPSPVRHGFVPEEWFTAFYPKTGASGPYVLLFTLSTYLVSKEIYILEHEFYNGLSLLIICIGATKMYGPKVAEWADKEIDKIEAEYQKGRDDEVVANEQLIENQKKEIWSLDGQKMIMDIKKENIKMQLEATYRERMTHVYQEVKKRLDYQVQIQNLERRLEQKYMVQWIIDGVMKAITPDQEKAALQQCIKDLEVLSAKA